MAWSELQNLYSEKVGAAVIAYNKTKINFLLQINNEALESIMCDVIKICLKGGMQRDLT